MDKFHLLGTTYVFSPEPVTIDMLQAYLDGESTPPMFVIEVAYYDSYRGLLGPVITTLYQYAQADKFLQLPALDTDGRAITMSILTDDEDWQENSALYEAMLDFPFTYQYHYHENLRHSLLSDRIGYPDGWIEYLDEDENVYFLPEGSDDIAEAIFLDYENAPLSNFRLDDDPNPDVTITNVAKEYGIIDEDIVILKSSVDFKSCYIQTVPLYFETDTTRGYIRFIPDYVVKISVGIDATVSNDILFDMAESRLAVEPLGCG